MKTANFTPHQAAVDRLLKMLNLNTTNDDAARIAAAGETVSNIASAIRRNFPISIRSTPLSALSKKALIPAVEARSWCSATALQSQA